MRQVIILNDLATVCGYFTHGDSGYCCLHPLQKERENDEGKCFSFSCPIAYEADLASIRPLDLKLYEEVKREFTKDLERGAREEDCSPALYGGNWMIWESEPEGEPV
jgi:hypothetical protein